MLHSLAWDQSSNFQGLLGLENIVHILQLCNRILSYKSHSWEVILMAVGADLAFYTPLNII